MPEIAAVVSDARRSKLAKELGAMAGFSPFNPITTFKVGLGGWINPGTGQIPRDPDSTLSDVDVIENPSRYAPVPPTPTFSKALTPADFTYEVPGTLVVRCLLDFGEFNDDGLGGNPIIWELGLFDSGGTMVAYGTFPGETKTNIKQIENVVRVYI